MAILKILSRHSPTYSGLINYILKDVKAKDEIFTQNLRSMDIDGFVREFLMNESFRLQSRRDMIYLTHEVVSFSNLENKTIFNQEMLADLAQKYLELRGNTGVALAAWHHDKEHLHLHACVSGLHFRTGKSFGLSKAQLHEVKVQFQEYHKAKYPELTMSAPKHGKGERSLSHAEWHRQQRQQFSDVVRDCFSQARSQQHFLDLLRDNDLHHYERNGKPTGIEYDGAKFRFSRLLDDKQFETLPIELGEEEIVLDEIRSIRRQQIGRNQFDKEIGGRER